MGMVYKKYLAMQCARRNYKVREVNGGNGNYKMYIHVQIILARFHSPSRASSLATGFLFLPSTSSGQSISSSACTKPLMQQPSHRTRNSQEVDRRRRTLLGKQETRNNYSAGVTISLTVISRRSFFGAPLSSCTM